MSIDDGPSVSGKPCPRLMASCWTANWDISAKMVDEHGCSRLTIRMLAGPPGMSGCLAVNATAVTRSDVLPLGGAAFSGLGSGSHCRRPPGGNACQIKVHIPAHRDPMVLAETTPMGSRIPVSHIRRRCPTVRSRSTAGVHTATTRTSTPQQGQLWVVLAVVAAVVVAGVIAVVAFAFVLGDDIDDVEAADCITLSGANSDADFDIVDCGTTSPLNFIVAETLDFEFGFMWGRAVFRAHPDRCERNEALPRPELSGRQVLRGPHCLIDRHERGALRGREQPDQHGPQGAREGRVDNRSRLRRRRDLRPAVAARVLLRQSHRLIAGRRAGITRSRGRADRRHR